jgi:2-polyprenyl-3-methyl-5-hydroxy-6-metoxy-1,4-benzoquinol methylase
MEDDGDRWDERYRDQPIATASPPEAVAGRDDLLALIPTEGDALDIACGAGAQTLWMARRGLHVTALDVSSVALRLVEQAAAEQGVGDRVTTRRVDMDRGLPEELTDVDVIVCQRYRDPLLYPAIAERLRPGGVAIVTVLSTVGLHGAVGPFHAPPGELVSAFTRDDVEILDAQEGSGQASVVSRRC